MTSTHSSTLMELLMSVLGMMTGNIPMLLAYVVALVILITRWRQAPRASLLALCGILFGMLLLVLVPVLNVWMVQKYSSSGSSTDMMAAFGVLALASSIAHAIAFGFLFLAIYADRRYFHAPPPPE